MMNFRPPSNLRHWKWAEVNTEENEFKLYSCSSEAGGRVHYALVTREGDNPLDIVKLQYNCRKLQLIYPTEKISHLENGTKMITLLYKPFKTFERFMNFRTSTLEDPRFVGAVEKVITGLINLHKANLRPSLLNKSVLVIHDDNGGGGLLYLPARSTVKPSKPEESIDSTVDKIKEVTLMISEQDFKKVADSIKASVNAKSSPDLTALLDCMGIATTKTQFMRLLKAPYFQSPQDMVYTYIDTMYLSLMGSKEFYAEVKKHAVVGAPELIKESQYPELKNLWNDRKDKDITNDCQVMHFARNCVHHISREWEKERKDDDPEISVLVREPEKFLEEIDRWSPGIMNRLFVSSYKAKQTTKNTSEPKVIGRIPILDQM